jgi:hypothetical protein
MLWVVVGLDDSGGQDYWSYRFFQARVSDSEFHGLLALLLATLPRVNSRIGLPIDGEKEWKGCTAGRESLGPTWHS